ncbi:MAG: NAD(P)-dependent oxidoreductase [Sulfolobaceae archaeon]|nr:NAD(P)-dependent oxidoreductase [Sulfolobaceae archaeon]
MKEKVLVFGLGFIGSNVAKELVKDYETYITYRKLEGSKKLIYAELVNSDVHTIESGELTSENIRSILEKVKPDFVVNTIGIIKGSTEDFMEAHANIPKRIGEEMLKVVPSAKLIHISAMSAVGPIGNPIKEEERHCDPSIVKPLTDYDKSKCEGERYIAALGNSGLNYVIVRPTMVYGYYNDHVEFSYLYKLIKWGLIPKIDINIAAIYVKYLTQIIAKLIKTNEFDKKFLIATECELYNLGDIAVKMAHYMKITGIEFNVPKLLIDTFTPPSLKSFLAYAGIKYDCATTRKILGDIKPGLDDGIKEMIEWLSKVYG